MAESEVGGAPSGSHASQDPEALRAAARQCVAESKQLPKPLAVNRSYEDMFRVGYPMAANALNLSSVALDIWAHLPWVAMANARIALEHALTAQWVLLTDGGDEQLVKHLEHDYLTRTKQFSKALRDNPELSSGVDAGLLAQFEEVASRQSAPGRERSWSMQDVFARFDSSGLFYDSYRELSAAVHPSHGTITAHLDIAAEEGTQRIHPSGSGAAGSDEGFSTGVALASLWALDFIERCLTGQPGPSQAARIAVEVQLPYDLAFSDQAPERQPKR